MKQQTILVEKFSLLGEEVEFIDYSLFIDASLESRLAELSAKGINKIIVPIQSRYQSNKAWIEEIAEKQLHGDSEGNPWDWHREPPLLIGPEVNTNNGIHFYYLVNGIHRIEAYLKNGGTHYPVVQIKAGTQAQAIEEACGPVSRGNLYPEQPRTNKDKRQSVLLLLQCNEWWVRSDEDIKKMCGVSHTHVQKMRDFFLRILDNPKELHNWKLRVPENPDSERQRLEKLNQERSFTDSQGVTKTRKKRTSKEKSSSAAISTQDSKKSKTKSITLDTKTSVLETCTFTITPEVRDKASEIATLHNETIQGFFSRVVYNYQDWMRQIQFLQKRVDKLTHGERLYSQDKLEPEIEYQIATFSGAREREVRIVGSDNADTYIISPKEKFVVLGTCMDEGGFYKVKSIPCKLRSEWGENLYIALPPRDLQYEQDLAEPSVEESAVA